MLKEEHVKSVLSRYLRDYRVAEDCHRLIVYFGQCWVQFTFEAGSVEVYDGIKNKWNFTYKEFEQKLDKGHESGGFWSVHNNMLRELLLLDRYFNQIKKQSHDQEGEIINLKLKLSRTETHLKHWRERAELRERERDASRLEYGKLMTKYQELEDRIGSEGELSDLQSLVNHKDGQIESYAKALKKLEEEHRELKEQKGAVNVEFAEDMPIEELRVELKQRVELIEQLREDRDTLLKSLAIVLATKE